MLLYCPFDITAYQACFHSLTRSAPSSLFQEAETSQLYVESTSTLHTSFFFHVHLVPFLSTSYQSPTPHPHLNEHRQNRCPCKTQNSISELHTLNGSRPRCRSSNAAAQSCACKVSSSNGIVDDLIFETEHLPCNDC